MRIGFATNDWSLGSKDPATGHPTYGGSGWARVGLVAKFLRLQGFDVAEGTLVWVKSKGRFMIRTWDLGLDTSAPADPDRLTDVDLLVLQRWMFASVAAETRTAQAHGQAVVNDLDDHFWALDPKNQASRSTDPARNPVENRSHYLHVLRASTAVTVSTPYLAAEVRRLGVKCPVHVLENRVDVHAYDGVRERRRQTALAGRTPVVGWIGATPWRSGDLGVVKGVLGPFLEKHGLAAYHGGHVDRPGVPAFADEAGVDKARVVTRGMVPIQEYPSLFDGLDVGLVPLSDKPFNRAKSWIKGLEYAAAGVPFVASALPEYERLRIDHGMGVTVEDRAKAWQKAWGAYLDPDTRQAAADEGVERVKALDIRRGVNEWRDLYLDLLANA